MKRHLAIALCIALEGCVTSPQNNQAPTASEELLTSAAADSLARIFDLRLPRGTKVFLDTTYVDTGPQQVRYLVGRLREALSGRGLALTSAPDADVDVELVVAADSIDQIDKVYGVPSITLPSTGGLTNTPITTPEIAIYASHTRYGVVKVSATALDAKTHLLRTAIGPIFAKSALVNHHILGAVVLGDELEPPDLRAKAQR